MQYQRTLTRSFTRSGVGLHSGVKTTVWVKPAAPGAGRYFVRVDLSDRPQIQANLAAVSQTTLSTELGGEKGKVRTVEHLLAALVASGVDNACIEIDGPEVPLLDGSAQEWLTGIKTAGLTTLATPAQVPLTLSEPMTIQEGETFIAAFPAPETRLTYGIDFPYPAIGNQWHSWQWDSDSFAQAIAPARTFGFADQIEKLRQAGLIKGGSLDNALVCDHQGWLNPPLRFPNEPVRHKLLDLVGDLSLLGVLPRAHILAYKASHQLHVQLARLLLSA